jgi:hypothetical protein
LVEPAADVPLSVPPTSMSSNFRQGSELGFAAHGSAAADVSVPSFCVSCASDEACAAGDALVLSPVVAAAVINHRAAPSSGGIACTCEPTTSAITPASDTPIDLMDR